MRIAYIAAGAAGMYCGTCIHDNTLVSSIQKKGHNVALIPTYTAGSGLTLVGTQFNTADTGNFTKITFAQGAPASTDNVRIGYRAGDSAPATSNSLIAIGGSAARNIKENSDDERD